MKRVLVIFVLVLLSMPSLSGAAEEKMEMVRMDEVVVTSGRIEEKKEDVTTNITVLSEEEIEKSSVTDLVDLLEEEGFTIREYPNSLATVNIRGFTTNTQGNDLDGYVLLLINGRRSGTGNISEIPLDSIERVEIVRGPGAVQYGASALGGVINVITKKGEDKVNAYAETGMGSWNHKNYEMGVSGKINNFDYSLSGSVESQDSYDTGDGVPYYNTGFNSKKRGSISAGYTFMENHRISLSYSGYEGDKIGSPSYLSQNDLDDYVDNHLRNYDLGYTGKTTDNNMEWSFRYFITDREYENYDGNTQTYYQETDQQGIQAQLSAALGLVSLTGGIDWVDYEIEDFYSVGDNTYDNRAVFLLGKSKLLDDKLILSAGLRFDKYEIESDEGESMDDDNITPSIGAVYKIT
ncbi:MAG: TonB-dependent receptor, partial [Deltaproteobacteria bacterium]|nr:TonB-dependent receptor [Deltaproteobacteria bacterium]